MIAAALAEHGIRLKSNLPGEHRSTCPQCSAQRAKKTDPCLAVKIDGDGGATWTCHHCAWIGNVPSDSARRERERDRPTERPRRTKPTPEAHPDRPDSMYAFFAGRCIGRATVERFGCYVAPHYMPATGRDERCIVFPYTRGGELVNRKYRSAKKDFAQDKGAARSLFNLDALAGHDTAIFVEGEIDVLACVEAGIENVVSLPDGAPKRAKETLDPDDKRYGALAECEAELAHIERFILAGDADEAGRAHVEELARRLGKERCHVVRWPDSADVQRKDANETLQHDGAQVLRECIAAAEPYPVAGLYGANSFAESVLQLYRGGHGRGLSTGWPELDKHYTVRAGDLTIVTGIPNHGKSEVLDALAVNLARLHGWRIAMCSFENGPDEHVAKLAEKFLHAPFFDGPTRRMGEAELLTAINWINDKFRFIKADDEAPTIDWILERARIAVRRDGVRGLIIDPWNEIEATRPARLTETEYVSQSLGKVRRFARNSGCHVWFVAHPQKLYRENGTTPVPTLYDISGSAHWANKADFGIVMHRPDEHRPVTEVHIRKVRHKWLGRKGTVRLRYMAASGEFSDDMEGLP